MNCMICIYKFIIIIDIVREIKIHHVPYDSVHLLLLNISLKNRQSHSKYFKFNYFKFKFGENQVFTITLMSCTQADFKNVNVFHKYILLNFVSSILNIFTIIL